MLTLTVVVLIFLSFFQLSTAITQSKRISVAHERMDALSERDDVLSLRLDQLTERRSIDDVLDWPGKEEGK